MADDLFPTSAAIDDAEKFKAARVDFYNLYAIAKHGAPTDWHWHTLEALGKHPNYTGSLVRGCVPATFQKGKRKGQFNFKGGDKATELSFAIAHDQFAAFHAEWEAETGRCSKCFGSGQEWTGWSATEGSRFKPCARCDATGKPKEPSK